MWRVSTWSSSRPSAWARTRSRSSEPRTRPLSSRRPVSATRSRRSRPASWRSPTSTSCRKCDRSDANRTIVDLKQMLMLALAPEKTPWTVPVIGTSAVSGLGFDELVDAIERHREVAFDNPNRARPPAVDRRVPAAQDRREHAAAALRRGFCERRRLACRQAHAARERPVRDGIGISAAKNPPRIPGSAP